MIITEKMRYLAAIVLRTDADAVTKALLQLGVLEFLPVENLYAFNQGPRVALGFDQNEVSELRKRCDAMLLLGEIVQPNLEETVLTQAHLVDVPKAAVFVNQLVGGIELLREEQKMTQNHISLLRELRLFVREQNTEGMVCVRLVQVAKAQSKSLIEGLLSYACATTVHVHVDHDDLLLVFLPSHKTVIEELLNRFHCESTLADDQPLTVEQVSTSQQSVDDQLEALIVRQKELATTVIKNVQAQETELCDIWQDLYATEMYGQIQSQFAGTTNTYIFAGWLPASEVDNVSKVLQEITSGRVIIETQDSTSALADHPKAELEPPVKMHNPKMFKPFQFVVTTYGVPIYGTIDPTFVVSIFFILMFGLMFGDVGQGLILAGLGLFLWIKEKHALNPRPSFVDIGTILFYCGLSAVTFGALFGSYFGMTWLPPLWYDLHGIAMYGAPAYVTQSAVRSISDLFRMSFQFGFVVIGTGLLFNWVNKFRTRAFFELFFDKNGFFGVLFYAVGVYLIWHYVTDGNLSKINQPFTFGLLLSAVLAFAIIPVRHTWQHNRKVGQKLRIKQWITWPIAWFFEIFEMSIGYLSNTISFVRVAVLGLVHAVLMGSFYQMAEQTDSIFWGVLLVVFVNVLVIGLEGLLAGINSMRLNYYEFFSRYFQGGGRLYKPIALHKDKR
jgi:V/A-type H+-transporting ATPase subunit I